MMHVYEVKPRKDHRGVDLVSDTLPFGRLCYEGENASGKAIGYAKHHSRSHHTVIGVYVWQRDRHARAQRPIQRAHSGHGLTDY